MDTISERTRRRLRLLIAFLMTLLLVEVLTAPAQIAGPSSGRANNTASSAQPTSGWEAVGGARG